MKLTLITHWALFADQITGTEKLDRIWILFTSRRKKLGSLGWTACRFIQTALTETDCWIWYPFWIIEAHAILQLCCRWVHCDKKKILKGKLPHNKMSRKRESNFNLWCVNKFECKQIFVVLGHWHCSRIRKFNEIYSSSVAVVSPQILQRAKAAKCLVLKPIASHCFIVWQEKNQRQYAAHNQ